MRTALGQPATSTVRSWVAPRSASRLGQIVTTSRSGRISSAPPVSRRSSRTLAAAESNGAYSYILYIVYSTTLFTHLRESPRSLHAFSVGANVNSHSIALCDRSRAELSAPTRHAASRWMLWNSEGNLSTVIHRHSDGSAIQKEKLMRCCTAHLYYSIVQVKILICSFQNAVYSFIN